MHPLRNAWLGALGPQLRASKQECKTTMTEWAFFKASQLQEEAHLQEEAASTAGLALGTKRTDFDNCKEMRDRQSKPTALLCYGIVLVGNVDQKKRKRVPVLEDLAQINALALAFRHVQATVLVKPNSFRC